MILPSNQERKKSPLIDKRSRIEKTFVMSNFVEMSVLVWVASK